MDKNWIMHEDIHRWIEEKIGNEEWLTVYERGETDNENRLVWAFFIGNNSLKKEISEYTFNQIDTGPNITQHFDGKIEYSANGYKDRQALLYRRNFYNIKPKCIDISQEFALFHNLFFEKNDGCYYQILETAEMEKVIDVSEKKIRIKTNLIKQFLPYKNMNLVIGFVIERYIYQLPEELKTSDRTPWKKVKSDNTHYALWIQDYDLPKISIETIGKKIIPGFSLTEADKMLFNKKNEYECFPIGFDKNGNLIEFSCEDKSPTNYLSETSDYPFYLTPVFFSKDVLTKYYSKPDIYKIEDGVLFCGGLWGLRLDNDSADQIMVYLGDLGKIPFKEQKYWKSFVLSPSEKKMSATSFRRSILGEFADPKLEDLRFKHVFMEFNKNWKSTMGWYFFIPLTPEDEHHFQTLRVPINDNQQEFDSLVLSLSKILIDSINEQELKHWLIKKGGKKAELEGKKGIKKLESFCRIEQYESYEKHITFLVKLHDLRSTGAAHRKGEKYTEIAPYFQIDKIGYKNSFRNILKQAEELITYFGKHVNPEFMNYD